jgi:hypothetical protein
MDARKQRDHFRRLTWAKRIATVGIAFLLLLAGWPSVSQQAPGVNPGKVHGQKVPASRPENALQTPLPDAPSAVQRHPLAPNPSPPEARPNPDDASAAKDSAVSASSSTAALTSSAASAQPASLPLEWHENYEGCARDGGLRKAQLFIAQNLWVGTAPYNGGTLVFYLEMPKHRPTAACGATPQP